METDSSYISSSVIFPVHSCSVSIQTFILILNACWEKSYKTTD